MGEDLNSIITEGMGLENVTDYKEMSPLTLAYIGDAVYELIIRSCLVKQRERQVNKYHKLCSSLVNAEAQKKLIMKVMNTLTDEETAVFKRGRNAKSASMPKNASPSDYRNATGFEALCGYLYLSGRLPRLLEIISQGIDMDSPE